MNSKHISTLRDDELREHFKKHPTQPNPKYAPGARELAEVVKQDLLGAINQAIHQGHLDIDELASNIRDAGEYAARILGDGPEPDSYTLGVHHDWEHVFRASITGAGARVYTTPYSSSSPGLDVTSIRLPSQQYPESFLAHHGPEWFAWVHPRWRWVYTEHAPPE